MTTTDTTRAAAASRRRLIVAMLVVTTDQLMLVLDDSVVNIALPTIGRELDMSATGHRGGLRRCRGGRLGLKAGLR